MHKHDLVSSSLQGIVRIVATNEQGEKKLLHQSNLVVNSTYAQLAYLLSGDLTNREISKLAFGTGAIAAAVTDTTITHLSPQVWLALTVSYPTITQVSFLGTWESSVTKTDDITEIGLFFANNTLAARTVFQAMRKSAGWTWTILWNLSYTV